MPMKMRNAQRVEQPKPAPKHAPYPACNLGAHLKAPKDGEIVTEHQRGPKK